MGAIITLFKDIQIERIQFEEGDKNASILCRLTKEENEQVELSINFSDLNRILLKIEQQNDYNDVAEFDVFAVNESKNRYELDTTEKPKCNFFLPELEFFHPVRQIRA